VEGRQIRRVSNCTDRITLAAAAHNCSQDFLHGGVKDIFFLTSECASNYRPKIYKLLSYLGRGMSLIERRDHVAAWSPGSTTNDRPRYFARCVQPCVENIMHVVSLSHLLYGSPEALNLLLLSGTLRTTRFNIQKF
jgi:hypothetical protein